MPEAEDGGDDDAGDEEALDEEYDSGASGGAALTPPDSPQVEDLSYETRKGNNFLMNRRWVVHLMSREIRARQPLYHFCVGESIQKWTSMPFHPGLHLRDVKYIFCPW